jgi:hypothetical protein
MVDTIIELTGELNTDLELEGELNIDGSGTYNYELLFNKPQINHVELIKNKSLDDLGIQEKGNYPSETLTNLDIELLLDNFV